MRPSSHEVGVLEENLAMNEISRHSLHSSVMKSSYS